MPIVLTRKRGGSSGPPPPTPGQEMYIEEVMLDSPRAFWQMQEAAGFPQDSSGNGLHMTAAVGTPDLRFAEGPMGDTDFAVRFQGNEAYTRATMSTVVNNFTMEFFFSPGLVTLNDQTLIYNGNAGGNGWGLLIDTNGKLNYLAGGVAVGTASTVSLSVGTSTWYLLHCIRRATQWEYWINGVKDVAVIGTTAPVAPSGGTTLVGNTSAVSGLWAYAAIYETALSQARIEEHYTASGA